MAEKCGFLVEGVARGGIVIRGERVDGWFGSLLAAEWRARAGVPADS